MNFRFQGLNAARLFHGSSASKSVKLLYGESSTLFAKAVQQNLDKGTYELLDLGSHQGEFLEDLTKKIKDFSFHTTAIDSSKEDLAVNSAHIKIESDLATIPIKDRSVDITIARYAIAWNSPEKQKKIISEIKRVTKKIAIIQHQGADPEHPELLQQASKELFNGSIVPLKRDEFYFSSANEIESWFQELGIQFERIQNRRIDNLSEVYIEKYQLSDADATKTKEVLSTSDYLIQTSWILKF